MKVGDVIKRVRSIAGDNEVLQFTDDDIINWLNDGIRQCAVDNALLQKDATSNTVVGTMDYDLPTDVLKLHSVSVDGDKLTAQTLEEWQKTIGTTGADTATGKPQVFYVWAGKIKIWPAPDTVVPFKISYTYNPTDLIYTGSTAGIADATCKALDIPLPVTFQVRLVDYCLAQVAQQDGDDNKYAMKMQEFTTGVKNLKDVPEYQDDQYPMISVSARDGGGWSYYD